MLDCCEIITLSTHAPSTHAKTHALCLSLDFLIRQGNTSTIEAPFLWSGCGRVM